MTNEDKNTQIENTQNENTQIEIKEPQSKGSKILQWVVCAVCFVAAFVLSKGFVEGMFKSFRPNNQPVYSEEDRQLAEDAGFVMGFVLANTDMLEKFCSETGYVPNSYIQDFKTQFSKTSSNADKVISKYLIRKSDKKRFDDEVSKASFGSFDKDYAIYKTRYKISKKQYCEVFDNQKAVILKEKVRTLKQRKPHMYLD